MFVYEKVNKFMLENGYKYEDISKKSGIPIESFRAIMSGKQIMYANELRAICIALNVSPDIFVEVSGTGVVE